MGEWPEKTLGDLVTNLQRGIVTFPPPNGLAG